MDTLRRGRPRRHRADARFIREKVPIALRKTPETTRPRRGLEPPFQNVKWVSGLPQIGAGRIPAAHAGRALERKGSDTHGPRISGECL